MRFAVPILGFLLIGIVIVFAISFSEPDLSNLAQIHSDKSSQSDGNNEASMAADGTAEIVFGFDPRARAEEDARQYLPFLTYLEQATGYRFKLRFTPKGHEIHDDLGKNVVHLAAIGAVSFLKAQDKYGARPMARGLNHDNKAAYQSMIVVGNNSDIREIGDLHGRTMAFGSVNSTQGHFLPRIALNEHGIEIEDLASHKFTGSHHDCANAVLSGTHEACGLQDTMARDLAAANQLRIIYTSPYYPSSGIAASKSLPDEVFLKIQQALIDFDPQSLHTDGLYNWDKTEMPNGFEKATPQDYEAFRDQMATLGLL
ncbi:MAG: phosphate/phosphite/phosphonate ABC transporter substrate-binding protein [Rhodospirillaceae bacterium]|jgi:phosphonate transport system substrate-binding protein|nr:phosphate/phosphite/phosphonate ABC transporter substrate-binding protein [Rhodospirillaceae bacterium]MBT5373378.1 phosphate/phosphite/phosphonate ABC transporter substrate-binding protein [Rhodospirillaceae bacterium]MBT5751196.1 phosphate/phosphite/phosphonate ABC transporter substrate-binding protein [Rhodospirillaceae bacterium]